MINELIRWIVVIVVAAIFVTALRTRLQEYGFLLTLSIICVVLTAVFINLFGTFTKLRDLFNKSGSNSIYFSTALKALGISYIANFVADICRDFGLSSLAQTAETAGKVTIFLLGIPLMTAIMEVALNFIGL